MSSRLRWLVAPPAGGLRSPLRLKATLASHYDDVRKVYDTAPFYAPGPYEAWLISACRQRMDLGPAHKIADVGGGSGGFASKLKQSTGAAWLSVIEPSADMLAGASSDPNVDAAECQGAVEWAESGLHSQGLPGGDCVPLRFDRVLLKEVVHHLDAPERLRMFDSLRSRRLTQDGRVLVVTRPQHDIDYPLWPAAREVWAANQPSEGELIEELRAAGFDFVRLHAHAYPHSVPTDEWCRLVKGRFWSTFSNFSDAELEAGCALIREAACNAIPPVAGEEHLVRFEDRLLLIEARVTAR